MYRHFHKNKWKSFSSDLTMTTSLQCTAPQCAFKTTQGTVDQALQHLSLHAQTAHPVQQAQGGGTARGKVDRPTMKPACDQESWAFFLYDWENYKSDMNITGNATSAHLFGCLDEELKRDLQKAHQGVAAATMSEANPLQAIKRLAVKEESKLAHRQNGSCYSTARGEHPYFPCSPEGASSTV